MQIRVPVGDPTYCDTRVVDVLMQSELHVQHFKVTIAVHKALNKEGYVAAEWQTGMLISVEGAVYPTPKEVRRSAEDRIAHQIDVLGVDKVAMKIRVAQFDSFLNGPNGYIHRPV